MIETLLFVGIFLFLGVRVLGAVARLSATRQIKRTKGVDSVLATLGTLPGDSDVVRLDAQSASINVSRSSSVQAVTVRVNKPENWTVAESNINQVAVERTILSVFAFASDIVAIIAWLQGRHEDVIAHSGDQIEIVFPEDYAGDFEASYAGASDFNLGAWSGGNLKIQQLGSADGSFEDLSGLGAFSFEQDSVGETHFGAIGAKLVTIRANGSGDIEVDGAIEAGVIDISSSSLSELVFGDSIVADQISIDITGSGDLSVDGDIRGNSSFSLRSTSLSEIALRGRVEGARVGIEISGSGDLTIEDTVVARETLLLESTSLSEITLEAIEGNEVSLHIYGSGDLSVRNAVECDSFSSSQTSLGEIFIDELNVRRADINCSGSADFTADGGRASEGSATTTSMGDIHLNGDFDLRVRSTRNSGAVYINE